MQLGCVCIYLLVMGALSAGCSSILPVSSYNVNDFGMLELSVHEPNVSLLPITEHDSITVSRVQFWNIDRDVTGLLVAPKEPQAAIILVPGAGVTKEGHRQRAEEYATEGIAVLVLDIRGNGGETTGTPFSIEQDYERFQKQEWPQYYAIVADLIAARMYLTSTFHVPVYLAGESNGGRYAAIAVASDTDAAGFIGISTSGFGLAGNRYIGRPRLFLLSIDPDYAIPTIAPRPMLVLHAPDDQIIPYADGRSLYEHGREPKYMINMTSGHGISGDADHIIINYVLNFKTIEK